MLFCSMTTRIHNNAASPSVKLRALSLGNPFLGNNLSSIVFYLSTIFGHHAYCSLVKTEQLNGGAGKESGLGV